ncbi:MAG: hypothetical protein ACKOFX_03340 [Solirubrobacterales bacterium]
MLLVQGALILALFLSLAPSADASRTVPCEEAASGGLNQAAGQCVKFKKARLINGMAIAPTTAPARVKAVIEAANKIRNKPYRWGGGHGSFEDTGYDCSGAVSYALKGGNFVTSPLNSSGYMTWGKSGVGRWITVYTNPGHAYMVVAGLRFDTSQTPGDGPGWSKSMRSTSGSFLARSPVGF